MTVHRWTVTTLRRGVVLPCAPRNARWPIATHHPVVPSVHSTSVSPAPYPPVTPVHPRVTDTDTVAAVVVAVYCFAAHTSTPGRSRVNPRALVRCSTVHQPSTRRQRRRFAPECGGRRNQHDSSTPAHFVRLDETRPTSILGPCITASSTAARLIPSGFRLSTLHFCALYVYAIPEPYLISHQQLLPRT